MALLFYCENKCDPVGIQTQDLQNRNLTLYSAKLRDPLFCRPFLRLYDIETGSRLQKYCFYLK